MVIRVEGIINGDNVIFSRVAGDQREAQAPSSLDGAYVIEMTAYDEAGNIAHTSRYMLLYDPVNLCACLIPCPYTAEAYLSDYSSDVQLSDYFSELVNMPPGCGCKGGC